MEVRPSIVTYVDGHIIQIKKNSALWCKTGLLGVQ